MKYRFRQSLSTVLLYLLSFLIMLIVIGSITFGFAYIAAYFTQFSPITIFAWMLFMYFIGIPLSLLSGFFVPPFVREVIRKRRLRKLRQEIWR